MWSIESMKYVAQHGGKPRNLVLEDKATLGWDVQDRSMVLHGMVNLENRTWRYTEQSKAY